MESRFDKKKCFFCHPGKNPIIQVGNKKYPNCVKCGRLLSKTLEIRFRAEFSLPTKIGVGGWFFKKDIRIKLLAFIRNERKLTRQANDKKILAIVKDRVNHCNRTGASGEVTMAYQDVYKHLKELIE